MGAGPTRDDVWEMYYDAFAEINRRAAQRHRMTLAEFTTVMENEWVGKYLATSGDKEPLGLAVITNNLHAWPLISPEYFEAIWPDLYYARQIFYVGFVCVRPAAPVLVFRDLITAMYRPVAEADGVAVMDFCAANVSRNLVDAADAILHRLNPAARHRRIDTQSFHAWRFDGRTP